MNRIKKFQHYLSLTSELYCVLKLDGHIQDLIGPWFDMIGLDADDLESLFPIIHPEDIESLKNGLSSMVQNEGPFVADIRFVDHNQECIWFEIKVVLSKKPNEFVLRALDISRQKPLLLEIDSIQERLELAIRAVKFGVWDWNLKTGKLIWDSFMYELFELNESDFTSDYEAFEKTLFEEDSARVKKELDSVFELQKPNFESEFRIRTKHGNTRIIKAVASCFYDKNGKIDRLVGNNWDITKERDTEVKLQDAHYEIEKFFSISLDPLCVASQSGYLKRVNKAFVDILGYTEHELTSQPFLNFVHPDDVAATKVEMEKLERGIPTLRFENRYRTRFGSYRHFNWVVVPDNEKGLLYGVVRDMTDEIRNQHKALQAAQMASLGEMASGVAHEINNPLAIVQGKARQIEKAVAMGTIDADRVKADLQKIVSTTDRIVKIIKGLRSFSRDSSKDPIELTSIHSIIEEVIDLSGERFKHHEVELRLDIKSDIIIQCRGSQISQILMNLLNNGLDAALDCQNVKQTKWVEIAVQKLGARINLTVTDSGTGITPEVAEKMMRPFFTTKGVGKGTGLGLSISKGIAEDHFGTLRFEPNGINTRFNLDLPILQNKTTSGPILSI